MKRLLLPLAAAAAFVLPATAGAATFSGVVVAKQPSRHAVVVTSTTGVVRTVHTHRLGLTVGARVGVNATRLADGTFSATKVAVRGRAAKARIRGVVARRLHGRYLVSAGHSMLAIRTTQLSGLAEHGSGPPIGTIVDVTVDTRDAALDEEDVHEAGHAQRLELEGTLAAITPATAADPGELVLTVGKSTIDVVVPAGTTLPSGLAVGDKVEVRVTFAGDTFTLATSHEEDDDQGDDGGEHHDGEHHGGGGGGGGDG